MGRKKTTPVDVRNLEADKDVSVPSYYATFAKSTKQERKSIFDANMAELQENTRIRNEFDNYKPVVEEHEPAWIKHLIDLLPTNPLDFEEFAASDDSLISSNRDKSVTPDPPMLSPNRTNSSTRSSDTESSSPTGTQITQDVDQSSSPSVAGSQTSGAIQDPALSVSPVNSGRSSSSVVQDDDQGVTKDVSKRVGNEISPKSNSTSSDSSTIVVDSPVIDYSVVAMEIDSPPTSIVVDSQPAPRPVPTFSEDDRPKRARKVPRRLFDEVTMISPTKRPTRAKGKGTLKVAMMAAATAEGSLDAVKEKRKRAD